LIREKETNSGKSIASWGWLWDLACQSVGEKKKKRKRRDCESSGRWVEVDGNGFAQLGPSRNGKG
jgi:hypothetical protein